jgi:hypothetical protein
MTLLQRQLGFALVGGWCLSLLLHLMWLVLLDGWSRPVLPFNLWSAFALPGYVATVAWTLVVTMRRARHLVLAALPLPLWCWLRWLSRPPTPSASVSRLEMSPEPIYSVGVWSMRLLPWLMCVAALAWLVWRLRREAPPRLVGARPV